MDVCSLHPKLLGSNVEIWILADGNTGDEPQVTAVCADKIEDWIVLNSHHIWSIAV